MFISKPHHTITVVVSNLVFYTGDPGSSPGSGILVVRLNVRMEIHTCCNSQK